MNEKIQHTPGPWTAAGPGIRETAGRDPRIMVLHPDGQRLIATTHEGSCLPDGTAISKDEQRANASLIAQAPTMAAEIVRLQDVLAALTLALRQAVLRVELANKEGNPILSAWLHDARAALRKAEGDTP